MKYFDQTEVTSKVDLKTLIEHLERDFARANESIERTLVSLPHESSEDALLGFMPAFDAKGGVVKLFTAIPDNSIRDLPNIQAVIVLFSSHGTPVAVLEGTSVTRLRTSAASALASRHLSREDSSSLVLIGDGALAPTLAIAHCLVRPIRNVQVFGSAADRISRTVSAIRSRAPEVSVSAGLSLKEAIATADIVSCATTSAVPVFEGKWLKPGAHVDLVGSFSPTKREADDDAVRNSRIFVDTFAGALGEAGDLLLPLQSGVIRRDQIVGELADLVKRKITGREGPFDITVFKSVGTALEDLTAARLLMETGRASN